MNLLKDGGEGVIGIPETFSELCGIFYTKLNKFLTRKCMKMKQRENQNMRNGWRPKNNKTFILVYFKSSFIQIIMAFSKEE